MSDHTSPRHAVTRTYRTTDGDLVNVVVATYSDRGDARRDTAAINADIGFPLLMLVAQLRLDPIPPDS